MTGGEPGRAKTRDESLEGARPDWIDDVTKRPPYPLLRCDRCKAIFSDHAIHICADRNKP
jgi:hypothetical protein